MYVHVHVHVIMYYMYMYMYFTWILHILHMCLCMHVHVQRTHVHACTLVQSRVAAGFSQFSKYMYMYIQAFPHVHYTAYVHANMLPSGEMPLLCFASVQVTMNTCMYMYMYMYMCKA